MYTKHVFSFSTVFNMPNGCYFLFGDIDEFVVVCFAKIRLLESRLCVCQAVVYCDQEQDVDVYACGDHCGGGTKVPSFVSSM